MIHLVVLLCVLGAGSALAEQAQAISTEPLPEPMTLSEALRLSRADVPGLLRAEAGREAAEAERLSADALTGVRLTASASARVVDPSYKSDDDDPNDSRAILSLRKRLYDFGYSDSLQDSAEHVVEAGQWHYQLARQQAHLAVMRAFFDVLLADLEYARDNEAMSIAFIAADRARDRNELGQMSDVEMLQAEADYQQVRRSQHASSSRQLLSRSQLALAMGRPGELVSDLITPTIGLPESDPDDFHVFWQQVLEGHPELRALRAAKQSARQKLAAARAAHGPVLSAELDASVYNRNTSSTHPLAAGLVLEMPLLDGGHRDAGIARAQAGLGEADAALREAQLRLNQEARELWAARRILRADIQAFQAMQDYRDLYLDRSRALYELEVKADLGDAMTQISEVRLKLSGALFEWAMNEARIKAMTGQLLEKTQ